MKMYFQNPFAMILHLLCRNELSNPDSVEFWQTGKSQSDNIICYRFLFLVSVFNLGIFTRTALHFYLQLQG